MSIDLLNLTKILKQSKFFIPNGFMKPSTYGPRNGLLVFVMASCLASCSNKSPKNDWSNTVSNLIYTNCAPCHRENGIAPFPLTSYEQVKAKANRIRWATQTRYMPPWPADPEYRHFLNERVLTQQQIEILSEWIKNGLPRGDTAKEPPLPVFAKESFFRKPDLVLRLQHPIQLNGNGRDSFIMAKFPYRIARDTVLDFVEFVPGLKQRVHHVNGHLLSYTRPAANPFNGAEAFGDTRRNLEDLYSAMGLRYTDQNQPQFPLLTLNTVYYLPGYIPFAYPETIGGIRLYKTGAFLLNNIHYGPSLKQQADSSKLNVFFRAAPVKRPYTEAQIGTLGLAPVIPELVIPAGVQKQFTTQIKIQKKISLLSVNPHMHQIGVYFKAYAICPSGDTVPLIRIPRWDFKWQYYYTYPHPLVLEAGTVIKAEARFDNRDENPNNPFHPPQTIRSGNGLESMTSREEMFQFIFTYLPYRPGDDTLSLQRTFKRSH